MARTKITGINELKALESSLSRVSRREGKIFSGLKLNVDLANDKDLKKIEKRYPKALAKAHKQTLAIVAEELEIALGLAMETKAWSWDYGDGDIVQTGALRDSLTVSIQGNRIAIAYREEYAAIVYYGGYIHPYGNPNVQIYMPGRPWVDAVLTGGGPVPKFDFEGIYAKYFVEKLRAELSNIGAI